MATDFKFVGPTYDLKVKRSDTQRSINLMPTNIESGSGKSGMFLKPVPGLNAFSQDVCGLHVPDASVFSLLRFDEMPPVETVTATELYRQPELETEAPSFSTVSAPLIRCSSGALKYNINSNGVVVGGQRNDGEASLALDGGFTLEMWFWRAGGAAFTSGTTWEISGTTVIQDPDHPGYVDTNLFNWWWHGGNSYSSTSYIGCMLYSGDLYVELDVEQVAPDSEWTHIAFVVDDDEARIYVGGVLVGTGAITGGSVNTYKFVTHQIDFFYGFDTTYQGAVDEYRLSGKVRYTGSSFTPPTHAFPDPNP